MQRRLAENDTNKDHVNLKIPWYLLTWPSGLVSCPWFLEDFHNSSGNSVHSQVATLGCWDWKDSWVLITWPGFSGPLPSCSMAYPPPNLHTSSPLQGLLTLASPPEASPPTLWYHLPPAKGFDSAMQCNVWLPDQEYNCRLLLWVRLFGVPELWWQLKLDCSR